MLGYTSSTIHDWGPLNLQVDLVRPTLRKTQRNSHSIRLHASNDSTKVYCIIAKQHTRPALFLMIAERLPFLNLIRICAEVKIAFLPMNVWSEECLAFDFIILSLIEMLHVNMR